jgi:hypothetical protein
MLFGITDNTYLPGWNASAGNVELGLSIKGASGAWMMAHNNNTDDSNKYSLWKAELGSDTYYNATQYVNFDATDATGAAEYKEWRLEYDHSARQLDAYVGGASIGSVTLAGQGFKHGGSLQIGAYRYLNAVSGTLDADVCNLNVSVSGSTSLVSNYLRIEDDDEYGYQYYEKLDSTIVSGTGYAYQGDWQIETYSITSNVYVTTLGFIEDGHRAAQVVALYDGDRKIGLYNGGDPREVSSYTAVEHDWTIRSTYKIVSDMDRLRVYVDGGSTPYIDSSYENLPETKFRRVRFGVLNPDIEKLATAINRNTHMVTTSGSWTTGQSEPCYYGGGTWSNASDIDTKHISYINDNTGAGSLYMTYVAYSNRSTAVPVTIYHNGVVDTPTPDSYATNPINTVNDNVDEFGNADANATTVLVNQQCLSDGSTYSRIGSGSASQAGMVYLGRYTDIGKVVVTCDGTGSDYVIIDTFVVKHTDTHPRSRSVSRVYGVSYTVGSSEVYVDSDFRGGFTIIDMSSKTQIDAYSDQTSPGIVDDSISDFDVVQ